jgi:hypothetical protein
VRERARREEKERRQKDLEVEAGGHRHHDTVLFERDVACLIEVKALEHVVNFVRVLQVPQRLHRILQVPLVYEALS